MKYSLLGRTGLYVSRICFGAMTFGGKGFWEVVGKTGQEDAERQVAVALDAGVNFFDTANVYSQGESEIMLGKALGARRKDVVLATKVRGRMGPGVNEVGLSRRHILSSVDESLRRLGTDWIDLYQIHGVDPVVPLDETMGALEDCVRSGKVRYLGCSNLAAWQIMKAQGIAALHGHSRFESLQAYYTIAGRDLEREIVPMLLDQGMGLMVWSPLAGGLLSGKFRSGTAAPTGTRRSQFDFPVVDKDRAFRCVDTMVPMAESRGISVARIALAYLLAKPFVSSIIIGAKSQEQLDDNLAALHVTLSAAELAALDEVSALPPEYPGWMIATQSRERSPAQ